MDDYLSKLNEQQRQAVEYCQGPQLVIAGAGSGKTRVLTYKIVHLLCHGYEPWRILALTFTNKAAREMRERIEALVGENTAQKLWMGTFHSIFARILRINADRIGFKSNFTIYDTADSKSLVKMIIKDMDLDEKVYKISEVLNSISAAKNHLLDPGAYAMDADLMQADARAKRPRTQEIYYAYMERCRLAGAMDFDDLLYYTNILLRDNPDVRQHYQEFFRYVLVDEYQDTNFAQHLIISQLTQGSNSLCVVGDDAQSIYSFRGANIQNILNLRKAYPTLEIFKLEQNYRSTQNIIDAANSLIQRNQDQIPKHIFSRNKKGERIEVAKCYTDFAEAYLVSNRLSQVKLKTGDPYSEFAILYRTNAQSRVIEEALRKRNIPYRIYGGLSFYQRKEIKDAIAYFRLSINPDDDEALKRIINFPLRGIGETTVQKVVRVALDARVSLWQVISHLDNFAIDINKGTRSKLEAFRALIQSFIDANNQKKNAYDLAKMIIEDTKLLAMLISDRTPESISKRENLDELLKGINYFVESRIEQGSFDQLMMADFLAEVSLATDQDTDDGPGEKVTLMTIHAAKGLEFGNVFVIGVEEDLLPSSMSQNRPSEIEEERRLLYVAITRAKRFCMMTYASERFRNGETTQVKPSRFLQDFDAGLLNFEPGSEPVRSDVAKRFRDSYHTPIGQRGAVSPASTTSTWSSRNSDAPQQPRPEINAKHSAGKLRIGMKIEHSKFGLGTIKEIDTSMTDDRIKVLFDNGDIKTLILRFAKFNIINDPS